MIKVDYKKSNLILVIIIAVGIGFLYAGGDQKESPTGKPVFKVLPAKLVSRVLALRKQALMKSKAYDFLTELTTKVGPRFAGSANDGLAVDWAQRKLRELEFSNVRAEEVTIPCWQRGEATGEIISPPKEQFNPMALGGSLGTSANGLEAEVIEVEGLEKLATLKRAQVAGKIVFFNKRMHRTMTGLGHGKVSPIRYNGPAQAAKLGAAAVLMRSVGTSNLNHAHTGITVFPEGNLRIPAATLSNPEADRLALRLGRSGTIRFRLKLGCRFLPDSKSANVIGEIPGREVPQEVVLLAAHLDSWDVGTGALDDGAGCAIITEVARMIGQLDPGPRRTIRVLLAAGEEIGVYGGLAYDDRYVDVIQFHVAAMEADYGAGRVWGFSSRLAKEDLPIVKDIAQLLAPLGIKKYNGNHAFGGVDILPLFRHRVPLFEMNHDATTYYDYYHSAGDTLDKVNPQDLAQNVAAYAVVTLVAAELKSGFKRAPVFRGILPAPFDKIMDGEEIPR